MSASERRTEYIFCTFSTFSGRPGTGGGAGGGDDLLQKEFMRERKMC